MIINITVVARGPVEWSFHHSGGTCAIC